jgi:hypothetical protein
VASSYAATVLADEPVAYWRLGDSMTAIDEIGQNPGLYRGVVTQSAGAIVGDPDTATTFDGMTTYVEIGNRLGFEGMAAFSLEAWLNPASLDGFNGVITKAQEPNSDGVDFGYALEAEAGKLVFERNNDPMIQTTETDGLPLNRWSHVVATFDGFDLRLYVDGMLKKTSTAPTVSIRATQTSFVIGARNGGAYEFFDGSIDEVAVYARALSAERINLHRVVALGGQ